MVFSSFLAYGAAGVGAGGLWPQAASICLYVDVLVERQKSAGHSFVF